MEFKDDISSIKGIGEKTAALFNKVGVFSLSDLIRYFPASYIRYPAIENVCNIRADRKAAVCISILEDPKIIHIHGRSILSFNAGDDTGKLRIIFFNAPYLKKNIASGMKKVCYGGVRIKGDHFEMVNPKMYTEEDYANIAERMTPVYPLTKGLTENAVIKAVNKVFASMPEIKDYLSEKERNELALQGLLESIHTMHFPENEEKLIKARERVVFDEFYRFIRSVRSLKADNECAGNDFPMIEVAETKRLIESLPFRLTDSQQQAYNDIIRDLGSEHAMNRLIEGDVGSGKTAVAMLAMLTAVKNGHQAALMAPTEVLAFQHMQKLSKIMKDYDVKCVLLTGALTEKQKKEAREEIRTGEADIVIGTHALITDLVEYKDLALVVTDEQHRFGVKQRKTLSDKADGKTPHVLVMSATPIPRTLAIILYGDLDISVMKDRPTERLRIKNAVVGKEYRKTAYNFIKKEVASGHQAYVICPLIEPGDSDKGENATEYAEKLQEIWGASVRVGLLHGKMKNSEKNQIMSCFANADTDVLVSTTVVEVGVDVPNATVMMIEDAQNYGLSQLHQLRGRIGRGSAQSYCIFVDTSEKKEPSERLQILNKTNDGFEIASEDLKLRGPGDIFGIRQSGDLGFKVGDIYTDADILKKAADFAAEHANDTTDKIDVVL
ncbi:MAG: ATP-dependent DNA helicase RecG [Lachnospiraceae bacterium]|nr:ATP-dependent DNA helicase RecG [Lachnospiraceae bacterium]